MKRSSLMRPFAVVALLWCLHWAAGAYGANPPVPAPPSSSSVPEPSFQPIEDVPGLPRVLLIGDSISIGYTLPVRQLLQGKANVHRIPANAATTATTLAQFGNWIGDEKKWDVIHFNWGLHDLRLMPDGKHQVSLADYERNLHTLVDRLQPLGKKLIWCSTTPVPGTDLEPPRRNQDVLAYNAVALRVMTARGIPTNDLYAFALPQAGRIRKPLNVHFTPEGCKVLARQVARCIEQILEASGAALPP